LASLSGSTVKMLISVVTSVVTAMVAFMVPSKIYVAGGGDTMKTLQIMRTDRPVQEILG